MTRRKIGGYSLAALAILVWIAVSGSHAKRGGSRASGKSPDESRGDAASMDVSHRRPTLAERASAREAAKFRRFLLPPMRFTNTTLEAAIAQLIQAYRDTAAATGETAVNLNVDLTAANTRPLITCKTPLATADSVLRLIAALAGNRTEGTLPDYSLVALDDTPDKTGSMDFTEEMRKGLQSRHHGIGRFPSNTGLQMDLADFGMGERSTRFQFEGDSITYQDASAADLERLNRIVGISRGDLGPLGESITLHLLRGSDALLPPGTPEAMSGDAFAALLETMTSTPGTDLVTTAMVMTPGNPALLGESAHGTNNTGKPSWSGTSTTVTATPVALGHQLNLSYESFEGTGAPTVISRDIYIPDEGAAISIGRAADGQVMLICPTATLTNPQGDPLNGSRKP